MNRYGTAVLFTLEKNVWQVGCHVTFGAAGAPTLDTSNSKGICAVTLKQIAFTGTTANASPTVSSVSSFAGLYPGMAVVDSGPTHVNSTISSMNGGAGTITLAGNATGTNTGLIASGGQYVFQFGAQAAQRLDTYVKLLGWSVVKDLSSAQGDASTLALAPAATQWFMVGNRIATRTIPPTSTSPNTDATITLQCGNSLAGTGFIPANPASGEGIYVSFIFGASTAL